MTETTCPGCGSTTLLVVGPDQFGCETCGYATDNFERLVTDALATAAMDADLKLTPEMHARLTRLLYAVTVAKNDSRSEVPTTNHEPKALTELFTSDQNLAFGQALLTKENKKLLTGKGRNRLLCKWVDSHCETPLPDDWKPKNGGRGWADAYKDELLAKRIHSLIDYVMGKMIKAKLLPSQPTVQ